MFTLIIEDRSGRAAEEISFEQGSYSIGRVEGNDIILPSNSISRTHARIFVSNGKCYIDDLGSANGITIDGVPVTSRQEVTNNSTIRIGEYTLYLEQRQTVDGVQDVLRTQIVSSDKSGYKLVRVGDGFAGEEFAITEQTNSIGRTEDNYILLSDSSISRNHAQIINSGITYKLVDLGSSNGTFVNGKPVKSEVLLQSEDEIRFGNIHFVFVPSSKQVDLSLYARKSRMNSKTLAIAAGVMFVVIVIIVALIIGISNHRENARALQQEHEMKAAAAERLNNGIAEIHAHIRDKQFSRAEEVVQKLLKENPDHPELLAFETKIADENRYDRFIREGDRLADNKEYLDAISSYERVPVDSSWHKRAVKSIEEAKVMHTREIYASSKSACTMAPAVDCIINMCEAAIELKGNRINETRRFMESLVKTKGGVGDAAKNCLNDLEDNE